MTAERKIIIVLSIVLAAILGFGVYQYFANHEAIAVANAKQAEDEKQSKVLSDQQAVAQKQIADRDQQLATFQAQIATQIASVKSTSQAATVIDHYLPTAAPVQVQTSPPATGADGKPLPNAPAPQQEVLLSQTQSVDLAQHLLQCTSDQKALTSCKADTVDYQGQLADEKKKTALAQADAAQWEKTAKGGSLFHRILVKAAWTAAIAGAGVGGYELGQHH